MTHTYCHKHGKGMYSHCQDCVDELVSLGIQADKDRIAQLEAEVERLSGRSVHTPTQIEAMWPAEVVAAWHWVKTYAPHRATQQGDQQTYDTLGDDMKDELDLRLAILRPHGLVRDAVFQPKLKPGMAERRPNFIVLPLAARS